MMALRARLASGVVKVLVITACWTAILGISYVGNWFLIGDLVRLGKLQGRYAFWPDMAGTLVLGVAGGLVGGSLLVFRMNAGYRDRTFLSGIGRSALYFMVFYLVGALVLLFGMSFVFHLFTTGVGPALASAAANVRVNFATPSFLSTMLVWGMLVSGTQFMLQVNDKFGPGVLWKFLTGRYYRPREEERVFMFLDLRGSTEIAERLGHHRFFLLLKALYEDITGPVLESRGEIHQYVGDEVVITWPVTAALEDAQCVACFFRIERALAARRREYLERYGVEPSFKAGLHIGAATVGEIGVVKKDIVYSGDVLNTTSRIQAECNRHDARLLVSAELLGRLPADAYDAVPIGDIPLRGKAGPLALYAVSEARPVPVIS